MTISSAEIFLLCGAGYVCGLAVSSGFMLSALLQIYVSGKSAWRMLLWAACMIGNTVTAALVPVFLIGSLVVGDQPGRNDFWPRAMLFGGGVGLGLVFVLISVHLINRHLQSMRALSPVARQ